MMILFLETCILKCSVSKNLGYFLKTKEMLTRIQPERNNTALLLKGENSFATHIGLVQWLSMR